MAKFPFFLLGSMLFALINLPQNFADQWRSNVILQLSPVWQSLSPQISENDRPETLSGKESSMLLAQIESLQELLLDEKRLQNQADNIALLVGSDQPEKMQKDALKRVMREKQILSLRYEAMPASVIFRDPSSWSSAIWISIGEADNRSVGRTVIAPNSPVLAGHALIGVVEYVGESQARVRLISDSGLVLAVRALRGHAQNREIFHHVQDLLTRVQTRPDLFTSVEEQSRFADMLSAFKNRLGGWEEEELAKGEICGCSAPLFRARSIILKGSGFNYDYPDEAGPARDLRSGRPLGKHTAPPKALIQSGDLLITSGLDGIFPAGIPVAIATQVVPLKEGNYTYDLEAKPAAGDLLNLYTVYVLPPLGSGLEAAL
jgi:cell shape-determining protein MreC